MIRRAGALAGLFVAVLAACGGSGNTGQGGGSSTSTGHGGGTSTQSSTGFGGDDTMTSGAFMTDECKDGTAVCSPDAMCVDTPNYYDCVCKPGYDGDGKMCADINECDKLLDDCDSNADCTNTPGGFTCACSAGFTGDGKTCAAMYSAVSAGQFHACAVRSDKTIWCWGLNTSGQVGTATGDPIFLRPAQAGSASNWARVAAGATFSCALDDAGAISCWGSNSAGQIGDGTANTALTPTPVAGGATDYAALDSGLNHSCAIHKDGTISCWGTNVRGQIGDGTNNTATMPTPIGPDAWLSVSVGSEFTCAVKSDHTLWCWGLGSSKQLGNGGTANSSIPVQEKTLAADWAAVTAGNAFACAVKLAGTRWCWGTNSLGQCGDGTTTVIAQPTKVGVDTDWAPVIEAGDFAACALKQSGALYCWGDGTLGQTGQPGDESPKLSTVQVGVDMGWTALAGGQRFACGLQGSKLSCWGSASRAASGRGYSSDRSDPTLVPGATDCQRIAVQMDDGCAIHSNGDLSCWGRNAFGQLGDGTSVTRPSPVAIGAGKTWKRIVLGRTHTCGIAAVGGVDDLYCWGWDGNGELGNGPMMTAPVGAPTPIDATPGNTSPWSELAAGLNHTCAIKQDGTLWCWGRNALGQLGDTTTTARTDPKQVLPAGAADWVEVVATGEFTCARRMAGTVWCWGRNDVAQVGEGDVVSPVTAPKQVGMGLYSAIAAGANHACAVATDGSLWCWGRNASGELGLGNAVGPVLSPVQVGTATDWARPFIGQGTSTCAVKTSGDLYCWGTGSFGQLGQGNLTGFNTPQKVPSLSAWVMAALGTEHMCGLHMDGSLACWGGSDWAQLGSGLPFVSAPTVVVNPP